MSQTSAVLPSGSRAGFKKSQFYTIPWHSVTNKSHEPGEGYYSNTYKGDVEVTGNFPARLLWGQYKPAEQKDIQNITFQGSSRFFCQRTDFTRTGMGGFMAKQSNKARDTRPSRFSERGKAFRRLIKLELLLLLNISKGKGGRGSVSPMQLSSSSF